MTAKIKPTQLPRTGYSYQDLFCIQILVNWFHSPGLYKWVSIEGAEKAPIKFKGLDDIVALNAEGKYELYQVKFTIDSTREDLSLSFDWLLSKKENGTSLIQKWANDIELYNGSGQLSIAALKTNRVPDEEVAKTLNGAFIDTAKIPKNVLTKIETQLCGAERAKLLFSHLQLHHSMSEHKTLEAELHDSLVPDHTTEEGWLRFLKSVEEWATRKGLPAPDGQIKLTHLTEIFRAGISNSLSQFFEIPKGYIPPSSEFHNDIIDKTSSVGAWVISGRPGMGKSTYLSNLTNALMENGVPVVRHHYSMSSLSEVDRISFANVSRSIQIQLRELFPQGFNGWEVEVENLDKWLNRAIENLHGQDTKLVVIIDGLDHVRRERADISQLAHLLNRLLPFKNRMCILLGTQPISDNDLPKKMVSEISRETHWINIPPMDMQSIRNWLDALHEDGKIHIAGDESHLSSELTELAAAFYSISHGYPIYLLYSLRMVTFRKSFLSKYDVANLPQCPDGDIHQYYNTLWTELSAEAREVLLQISSVEFSWPNRNSLASCFSDSLKFAGAYDEIQHLFEARQSGIVPFHSSIMVFLKSKQEFSALSEMLMQRAKYWLENHAPEYWSWGWLWVISNYLGEPEPLLSGVTRSWLINSVCKGYPLQQIERIISIAEQTAFQLQLYPDLVRLRLIRIRLVNGPEFQIQEYHEYTKIALSTNSDNYSLLWRIDNIAMLNENELVAISSLSTHDVINRCFSEIIKRLEFYVKFDDPHDQKVSSLISASLDCLTSASIDNVEKICWFLDKLTENENYVTKVIEALHLHDNNSLILEFPKKFITGNVEEFYWNNFVLACCDLDISIFDRPEVEAKRCTYGAILSVLAKVESGDVKLNTVKRKRRPNHTLDASGIVNFLQHFQTLPTVIY